MQNELPGITSCSTGFNPPITNTRLAPAALPCSDNTEYGVVCGTARIPGAGGATGMLTEPASCPESSTNKCGPHAMDPIVSAIAMATGELRRIMGFDIVPSTARRV
jgi:hypothetical protein